MTLKEENRVLEGDCLEILKTLNSESVDLVITSPPYNLGNSHHTGNRRHKPYNDSLPEEDYQNWQIDVLKECHRVLKSEGSMFYNHKNRIKKGIQITPYEWLLKSPFIIKQELVWFNGSQNFDKIRFYPMTERVYWLAKKPNTKLFNTINHHDFFNNSEWKSVGIKGKHTRAFPEKMVTDIVSCFPDAKIILDPFAGSGTTGVACLNLKRNFILIEKEHKYIEIINSRLI